MFQNRFLFEIQAKADSLGDGINITLAIIIIIITITIIIITEKNFVEEQDGRRTAEVQEKVLAAPRRPPTTT